ncbi:MAG TPA: sugar-binding domain-containing protein [Phototrophicaceae bacterium]|nr:sugar-binding domain-containing protein [Phototrophicaceae bacterium]
MSTEPDSYKRSLLIQCAEMKYIEKLSNSEIAERLNFSVTHVGRLLLQAETYGIVEIHVRIADRYRSLERALETAYGLHNVRVVNTEKEYDALKRSLGKAGAQLLDEYLMQDNHLSVGIGGGASLLEIVEHLQTKPRRLDIYPLAMFGRSPQVEFVSSNFLVSYLLIKTQPLSRAFNVSLPPLPEDRQQAQELSYHFRSLSAVKHIVEASQKVDLAFVGLVALTRTDNIFREFDSLGYDQEYFFTSDVVGGINYNFFDHSGQQVGDGLMTLSIDQIRAMSNNAIQQVILVAGGDHKREAIYVAVKNRMVNGLITDEATARFLQSKI